MRSPSRTRSGEAPISMSQPTSVCVCAAEVYSAMLKLDLLPGQDVTLDNRWTDELRIHILENMPRLAAWISDQADKLAGLEAEEDAALGEA